MAFSTFGSITSFKRKPKNSFIAKTTGNPILRQYIDPTGPSYTQYIFTSTATTPAQTITFENITTPKYISILCVAGVGFVS